MIHLLLLLLLLQPVPDTSQIIDEARILSKGLELKQQQQYEPALPTRGGSNRMLDTPRLAIGGACIQLDAEQKLESHYQPAATLYQWRLSAGSVENSNFVFLVFHSLIGNMKFIRM